MVFFIALFPFFSISGDDVSPSSRRAGCLLPPTCLALGTMAFTEYEDSGEVLTQPMRCMLASRVDVLLPRERNAIEYQSYRFEVMLRGRATPFKQPETAHACDTPCEFCHMAKIERLFEIKLRMLSSVGVVG